MIAILIKSLVSRCGNQRDYRMGIGYTEINPKRRDDKTGRVRDQYELKLSPSLNLLNHLNKLIR